MFKYIFILLFGLSTESYERVELWLNINGTVSVVAVQEGYYVPLMTCIDYDIATAEADFCGYCHKVNAAPSKNRYQLGEQLLSATINREGTFIYGTFKRDDLPTPKRQ